MPASAHCPETRTSRRDPEVITQRQPIVKRTKLWNQNEHNSWIRLNPQFQQTLPLQQQHSQNLQPRHHHPNLAHLHHLSDLLSWHNQKLLKRNHPEYASPYHSFDAHCQCYLQLLHAGPPNRKPQKGKFGQGGYRTWLELSTIQQTYQYSHQKG